MALTDFHRRFDDSVRWRLTPDGVEIEGSGIERTKGNPATVTKVWESYSAEINRTARSRGVPCALIIATICTESGGRASAIRLEPGYKSDQATPGKVSPGLMQTLISTAREAMKDNSIDRDWLLKAGNSIEAGTAVIAKQSSKTHLDPPLVAAAYNSGGVYEQTGANNRWKLRQYPIGTSAHCDRFIKFFNDAVYVLKNHGTKPSVGIEKLLDNAVTSVGPSATSGTTNAPAANSATASGSPRVASSPGGRSSTGGRQETKSSNDIKISFGPNAKAADVTAYSRTVLEEIMRAADLKSASISSTQRNPADQARVMYNNLEKYGVAAQKKLYAAAGDKVIDVYAKSKAANKSADQIKADMERKIIELGPTSVSRHASDPKILNVFDVDPSSIRNRRGFEQAVRSDNRVTKFLVPPDDPGYHLEIPQKQ